MGERFDRRRLPRTALPKLLDYRREVARLILRDPPADAYVHYLRMFENLEEEIASARRRRHRPRGWRRGFVDRGYRAGDIAEDEDDDIARVRDILRICHPRQKKRSRGRPQLTQLERRRRAATFVGEIEALTDDLGSRQRAFDHYAGDSGDPETVRRRFYASRRTATL